MMYHVPTQHGGLSPGEGSLGELGYELMQPYCPSIVADPEGDNHFLGSAKGLRHEEGQISWSRPSTYQFGIDGLGEPGAVMPVLWDETDPPSPMDGEEEMNLNTGITPMISAFHQHTTVHCNKVYTFDHTDVGEHFTRMDLDTYAKPNYFPVRVPTYRDDKPYVNILYDGFPGGDEESCAGGGGDCTSAGGLIRCAECATPGNPLDGISYEVTFRRYLGGLNPACVDIPDFSVLCPQGNNT